MKRKHLILSLTSLFLLAGAPAYAAGQPFDSWLQAFREDARGNGISDKTLEEALDGIEPVPRVLELDRRQPEKTKSFETYIKSVVGAARIARGKDMMQEHREALDRAAERYGVAPKYIVALWGIETGYGANTGGFAVVPALATLAWDGRREAFFRKELMDALRIIDEGHIDAASMKGSWAGAMGQNQFMPSSFLRLAADGDGDGRKDIWNDPDDVFASTANYLASSGWRDGERWGREVRVPPGLPRHVLEDRQARPLSEWRRLGVALPGGGALPGDGGMEAKLVAPDGPGGRAYLTYDNYAAIMKWNRSTYFATAVGLLADALDGPR